MNRYLDATSVASKFHDVTGFGYVPDVQSRTWHGGLRTPEQEKTAKRAIALAQRFVKRIGWSRALDRRRIAQCRIGRPGSGLYWLYYDQALSIAAYNACVRERGLAR